MEKGWGGVGAYQFMNGNMQAQIVREVSELLTHRTQGKPQQQQQQQQQQEEEE